MLEAQNAIVSPISFCMGHLDVCCGGGMPRGQLITLGGRPGSGKTTLALQLAVQFAQNGLNVGMVSLEMSGEELMARATSAMATVPSTHVIDVIRNDLASGNAQPSQQAQDIMNAWGVLSSLPLHIDDKAARTAVEVDLWARRQHSTTGLDILILDHLQLVDGDEKKSRADQLDTLTRTLKGLARDLDCVAIVCSQLSRGLEQSDRDPTMSDLRDSGAVEQNSDVVLIMQLRPVKGTVNTADRIKKCRATFQ